jgi:hypothetical protein
MVLEIYTSPKVKEHLYHFANILFFNSNLLFLCYHIILSSIFNRRVNFHLAIWPADCDSALSSLGDVLRGLPEWPCSLMVLASLWRFKSLDITLCDTPNWSVILRRLNPVFRMPMTCHFYSSVNLHWAIHGRVRVRTVNRRLNCARLKARRIQHIGNNTY